jgi:hypothetical protein
VVGAVQGEVAKCPELDFDPIQPAGIGRNVGQLDVVGLGPVADPLILLRREVRAVVVQNDGDPGLRRVEGPEVEACGTASDARGHRLLLSQSSISGIRAQGPPPAIQPLHGPAPEVRVRTD